MNQLRDLLITFACRLLAIPFSLRARPLPAGYPFSSIVIVKPCCIGDVTLATPVVAALRQAYPQARLAFAVSAWAKEAIVHNPRVDELVDCGNVGSGRKYGWREYWSLVGRIREGGFELAVVLERSPLLSLIPFLAGVPYRAGIDSSGRGFSLTAKAPWRGTGHHEAELYLDVVRALGLEPGRQWAEFYASDEDRETAQAIPGGKLAMIHPGGAANPGMVLSAKRWPPDRFAALARLLIRDGFTVLLVGAASDRTAAEAMVAAMGDTRAGSSRSGVLDLVGKLSLGQMAALAGRCRVFIGNDTGPMHVAAATGTPTVAIFGPSTPKMYAPYGPISMAVYNQVDCSPCFVKGRFASSCRDYRCMRAVEVEDVWQAVDQVMQE